jgi:hypothetical protein
MAVKIGENKNYAGYMHTESSVTRTTPNTNKYITLRILFTYYFPNVDKTVL